MLQIPMDANDIYAIVISECISTVVGISIDASYYQHEINLLKPQDPVLPMKTAEVYIYNMYIAI